MIFSFFPFKIWLSLTFLWTTICLHPGETKSVHPYIWLKVLDTFSPLSGTAIIGICGTGFSLNSITFSFSHGMMRPRCVGGKLEDISLRLGSEVVVWDNTTFATICLCWSYGNGFTQIVGFHAMQDRAARSIYYVFSIMQIKAGLKLRLFGDLL